MSKLNSARSNHTYRRVSYATMQYYGRTLHVRYIIFLYYFMTGGKEYVEEYAENLLGHMTYIENAQQID